MKLPGPIGACAVTELAVVSALYFYATARRDVEHRTSSSSTAASDVERLIVVDVNVSANEKCAREFMLKYQKLCQRTMFG